MPPMADSEARRPRFLHGQVTPRLEDNLDALASAAFLVDLDDRVLGWNVAAAALLGVAVEHALGRRFRDLEASYLIPKLRTNVEELKQQPTTQTVSDASFRRGDGSVGTVRVTVAPVVEGGDRVVAILVTLEERTDHVGLRVERDQLAQQVASLAARHEKAEQQLLDTASELRSANEELTVLNEELQTRVAELEAAQASDRQKTEFLAILSHELRNPLAAVIN